MPGIVSDRSNAGSVALSASDGIVSAYTGLKTALDVPFTVEGWFKWSTAAETGVRSVLCGTYASGTGWKLILDDTGDAPRFRVYAQAGCLFTPCVDACFPENGRAVARGVWTHVALTYDPDMAGGRATSR